MTPRLVIQALDEGARGAVGVGAACVIIGVIIGTVSLTGLGLTFGYEVLKYVGEGQLYLGGLFVMIMSTILGMGVPGVLLSGEPGAVGRWRRQAALEKTARLRPDLLEKAGLSPADREFLKSLSPVRDA